MSTGKAVVIEALRVGSFELANVPTVICTNCVSLLVQAELKRVTCARSASRTRTSSG